MSDEPARPTEAPVRAPTGLFLHYCERRGCKEWGAYGYQAGKSQPQHFFCYAHRGDGERIIGRA